MNDEEKLNRLVARNFIVADKIIDNSRTDRSPTRVIIAGKRTVTDMAVLKEAIAKSGYTIDEVVSGGAKGVDALGEQWAFENDLPRTIFHADWDKHGKAAGPIRNREMAQYATCAIVIWDGQSKGSKNMIDTMRELCKPMFIMRIPTT